MKKFNFSHLLALAVIALSFFVFGCTQPNQGDDSSIENTQKDSSPNQAEVCSIYNTWTSSYGEVFTITSSNFVSGNGDEGGYEGTIEGVVEIDESSGTIFIKYTKAYEKLDTEPYYQYSTTSPDVGKYYAISYKDLTKTSISISGAYKQNGVTSTETLEEAKNTFTVENGYFSYYSECTKK